MKKRGMVKKEVNKMIGITDAFDCKLAGLRIFCFTRSLSSVLYCMLLTLYSHCLHIRRS